MARAGVLAVKHLTEAEFAEREGVSAVTAAAWRRDGIGPPHLTLTTSSTNRTIRYRLSDIEAWEESRLTPAATA